MREQLRQPGRLGAQLGSRGGQPADLHRAPPAFPVPVPATPLEAGPSGTNSEK